MPRTVFLGGVEVNAIALGSMPLGILYPDPSRKPSAEGAHRMLEEFAAAVEAATPTVPGLVDTADVYCGERGEEHEVERLLSRHPSLLVATKGGCVRTGDGRSSSSWGTPKAATPEAVERWVRASAEALRPNRIFLYQLHHCDGMLDAQLEAAVGRLAALQREGLLAHIGLCNCAARQARVAHAKLTAMGSRLAACQNAHSLLTRAAEGAEPVGGGKEGGSSRAGLLDVCAEIGATFLAYAPLGGVRARDGRESLADLPALAELARQKGTSPQLLALAWARRRWPAMLLPIVGARTPGRAAENQGAHSVWLDDSELAAIGALKGSKKRAPLAQVLSRRPPASVAGKRELGASSAAAGPATKRERRAPIADGPDGGERWSCSHCTFAERPSLAVCSICGNPRVASSARGRVRCRFGANCYRNGDEHVAAFSHPWDDDFFPPMPDSVAAALSDPQPVPFFLNRNDPRRRREHELSLSDVLRARPFRSLVSFDFDNQSIEVLDAIPPAGWAGPRELRVPVLLINHCFAKEDEDRDRRQLARHPNVKFCRAPNVARWGAQHTKMLLLFGDQGLTVVIHTGVRHSHVVEASVQGLWVSPVFPLRRRGVEKADRLDLPPRTGSGFERDFLQYLQAYQGPCTLPHSGWDKADGQVMAEVFRKVRAHDLTGTSVRLVASVPGRHKDDSWGLRKLHRQLVEAGVGWEPGDELIANASSIGALGATANDWWRGQLLHAMMGARAGTASHATCPELKFVYPSVKEVAGSVYGYAGGGKLPVARAKLEKMGYLRDAAHVWRAEWDERTRYLPHIKTYCCYSAVTQALRWFLLTSANLSHPAWGAEQKLLGPSGGRRKELHSGQEQYIQSYELGVLFAGGDFVPLQHRVRLRDGWRGRGCGLTLAIPGTKAARNVRQNAPRPFSARLPAAHCAVRPRRPLPVPYDLPLSQYAAEDVMWACDVTYLEPDVRGQRWRPPSDVLAPEAWMPGSTVAEQKAEICRLLKPLTGAPTTDCVELPPTLNTSQRALAHAIAEEWGLDHRSEGDSRNRRLVVQQKV